jgi:(S)-2-hydroxyglutarate dehydrogenase
LAYHLCKEKDISILILEKETDVGFHASGRNSGVLHAGIYYPSTSLKAKFCLEGNRFWKWFCKDNQIPVLESGKVLVSKNDEDLKTLDTIYERAIKNGADVQKLTEEELALIEPLAKTYKRALLSKETAIVNPKQILNKLKGILCENENVKILFGTNVKNVCSDSQVETNNGGFDYDYLINASGTDSINLAHKMGVGLKYRLLPFKGSYKLLNRKFNSLVKANIYPVPDLKYPFLGVHFTKAVSSDVYIGPTATPVFGPENYFLLKGVTFESFKILYTIIILYFTNKSFRKLANREPKYYFGKTFFNDTQKMFKSIRYEDVLPSQKVGIRPQLINWQEKKMEMDFVVEKTGNSLHVLNAISPAFTSAPAFSKYLVDNYIFRD